MQDQELNQLATQMVSQLKSMDDFKAMHKLMLQQFINNSLAAEMSEHLGYDKVSTRPFPIATSKHEAKAHQYPYLYG